MIEMIIRDKDIFRNISVNNSSNSLYALMIDMVAEQILDASLNDRLHNVLWIEETVLNATDQKLAANMIAGAFLTLLFKWVDSNYQMSSTELSDFIKHLHWFFEEINLSKFFGGVFKPSVLINTKYMSNKLIFPFL